MHRSFQEVTSGKAVCHHFAQTNVFHIGLGSATNFVAQIKLKKQEAVFSLSYKKIYSYLKSTFKIMLCVIHILSNIRRIGGYF